MQGKSRRLEVYGTRGSAILEPLEPPALRLCLDEARDGIRERLADGACGAATALCGKPSSVCC